MGVRANGRHDGRMQWAMDGVTDRYSHWIIDEETNSPTNRRSDQTNK